MAQTGILGIQAVASERSAEVEQVVLHKFAALLFSEHIQRVQRFRVSVVQPGTEDIQAAQNAKVFVRSYFVRIIGAASIILEAAQGFAWNIQAGRGPYLAIRIPV